MTFFKFKYSALGLSSRPTNSCAIPVGRDPVFGKYCLRVSMYTYVSFKFIKVRLKAEARVNKASLQWGDQY